MPENRVQKIQINRPNFHKFYAPKNSKIDFSSLSSGKKVLAGTICGAPKKKISKNHNFEEEILCEINCSWFTRDTHHIYIRCERLRYYYDEWWTGCPQWHGKTTKNLLFYSPKISVNVTMQSTRCHNDFLYAQMYLVAVFSVLVALPVFVRFLLCLNWSLSTRAKLFFSVAVSISFVTFELFQQIFLLMCSSFVHWIDVCKSRCASLFADRPLQIANKLVDFFCSNFGQFLSTSLNFFVVGVIFKLSHNVCPSLVVYFSWTIQIMNKHKIFLKFVDFFRYSMRFCCLVQSWKCWVTNCVKWY